MTPKRDPTPLESRSFLGVDVASEPANFISIEAGGSLVVENADPNGVQTAIFFRSSGTTLTQTLDVTGNAGGFAGRIFGFDQANDVPTIEQGDLGPNATEMFGFAPNSDSAVPYGLSNFDLTVTSSSIEITFASCFATGTLIETARGQVAVETLAIADRVSLATGGLAPVNWLGHRRQIDGEVVRIRAHALGRQSPNRDLIVSADHGMFLDGVLVQAGLLVNGETIVRGSRDEVTFWHVELDRRAILLAENAQAESCIDTGNRRQFGNCALSYDPIGATRDHCAEMVFAGARLDAIRAGLPVTVWSAR